MSRRVPRAAPLTLESLADELRTLRNAHAEQEARDAGYRPLVLCHPDQEDELRAVVDEKDLPIDVQANRWGPEVGTIYFVSARARREMAEPKFESCSVRPEWGGA